jgi:DNA invertase Pin-like site-specific DNA recombinase
MTSIGYIRNSRLFIQGSSLETQQTLITDFCKTHDIKLDDIIVDEGISGSGEKTHKRDGYNSVMKMVKKNVEVEREWFFLWRCK